MESNVKRQQQGTTSTATREGGGPSLAETHTKKGGKLGEAGDLIKQSMRFLQVSKQNQLLQQTVVLCLFAGCRSSLSPPPQ